MKYETVTYLPRNTGCCCSLVLFTIQKITYSHKSCFRSGTLDAILKMIRYEGLHGFYKGMSTKIVQSVLAAAVLFMVKEELVNGVRWMLLKDAAKVVKSKSP